MTNIGHRPAYPLLTPILEAWRMVVLIVIVAMIGTFVIRYVFVDRKYEARATLMAVGTSRSVGSGVGLAALSMLAGQQSGNTPPELVARVLVARHVLTAVGLSPVDDVSPMRVVDRVLDKRPEDIKVPDVPRAMSRALSVTIDRETGLIEVAARTQDSALARILVTRVVEVGGDAFSELLRAQGSAQREGQEARVALRAEQLREAERRRLEFFRTNRSPSPFSASAVALSELERDVELARQAYIEAVSAREAAFARELEQTPAMVVMDPVPTVLPTVPRYNAFYAIALGVFAGFLYCTLLLIREGLFSLRQTEDPRARRFLDAVRRLPAIGAVAGPR